MKILERLIAGPSEPDGQAAALEAFARPQRSAAPPSAAATRIPVAPGGETMVRDAILTKILHGWLQNRHQTLFPLTVNLRTLDQEKRNALANFTAIALLANASQALASHTPVARQWLTTAGAQQDTLDALDEALLHPPATNAALHNIERLGLAPIAYVAALISLDARDGASSHLLAYYASRLSLPPTLVRSAHRRYGK